jgi:hypothetical protein
MPVMSVLNRYREPVEIQFDAAFNPDSPYRWEPGEVKVLPADAAMFCRRKSVVKDDPITGHQVRALLVQGIDREYEEYAVKLASGDDKKEVLLPYRGVELLDRENMDERDKHVTLMSLVNPIYRPIDKEGISVETHARRVQD